MLSELKFVYGELDLIQASPGENKYEKQEPNSEKHSVSRCNPSSPGNHFSCG